jgi:hypothetical protein
MQVRHGIYFSEGAMLLAVYVLTMLSSASSRGVLATKRLLTKPCGTPTAAVQNKNNRRSIIKDMVYFDNMCLHFAA